MRSETMIQSAAVASDFSLDGLPVEQLDAMAAAGAEVVEIHRLLAKTGDNVVGELLKHHGTFYEWDHYPPGDVYDHETHGQYYYHAHAGDQRFSGEHGHFHTFVRPKGMPPDVRPARVPGFVPPADPNDALSHLVAIAMTPAGLPFRLFTVNRWVTGEVWYRADDVIRSWWLETEPPPSIDGTERYGRNIEITDLDRTNRGYRVRGRVEQVEYDYGRRGRGYDIDRERFTCYVQGGRVYDFRV